MSRSTALILLGVLVVLAPLSGLPLSWITLLLVILGVIIGAIGIKLRTEHVRRMQAATPAPAAAPIAMPISEPEEPEIHRSTEHHAHHAHGGPSAIA